MSQLTLIADVADIALPGIALPERYVLRPPAAADISALGRLYFAAYGPGEACDTHEEAVADMSAAFDGDYGELWVEASPVIELEGAIVAAIQVVRRAPWPDVPDCPFIIELFVDRPHRREGLASRLVSEAAQTVRERGEAALALRVMEANAPARALYAALGFVPV